jgi:DNA-directed RNA polymerase subunit M/transcription elongation factor TFIIS
MKKLSLEEIDKRIFNINKSIKRISAPYLGKITIICLKDNHIWTCRMQDIFRGHGCPKCSNNGKLSNEILDVRLKNRNIQRIDNYINNNTKIQFKCLICNNILFIKPNDILMNHGCSYCAKVKKLSNEILDVRLKNRNIQRIDNYINNRTKIQFKCLICNNIWNAKPNNILDNNQICPKCAIGKSEKNIYDLIYKINKFSNFHHHKLIIINNKKYFVDFYFENNLGVKVIIEYNGKQHYEPVNFGGISKERANINFENQQKRDDEIKKYCKENNIYLLEIPYYWDENKTINELNLLNNITL